MDGQLRQRVPARKRITPRPRGYDPLVDWAQELQMAAGGLANTARYQTCSDGATAEAVASVERALEGLEQAFAALAVTDEWRGVPAFDPAALAAVVEPLRTARRTCRRVTRGAQAPTSG
jgi:hypothetical protein